MHITERIKDAEDAGLPPYFWLSVSDSLRKLSVREKLRPKHWQEKLYFWFENESELRDIPANEELIRSAIATMMNGSRSWCNPELGLDEPAAMKALRTALDTIFPAQDSTGTGVELVGDVEFSPVDVAARTAALAREVGV
jgi:hypothetical protein